MSTTQVNIHNAHCINSNLFIPETPDQKPFVAVYLTGDVVLFHTDPDALDVIANELRKAADQLREATGDA